MHETEIFFNDKLQTYILKIDGHEVATGEITKLADMADELNARAECQLYGSYAYNKKDPTKKPSRCVNSDCRKCGWNPEVAGKRTEKLREKLGMA